MLAAVAALVLTVCATGDPVATEVEVTGDVRPTTRPSSSGRRASPGTCSTGDKAVHDGAIRVRTSPDGGEWTAVEPVRDDAPAWVADVVPNVEHGTKELHR